MEYAQLHGLRIPKESARRRSLRQDPFHHAHRGSRSPPGKRSFDRRRDQLLHQAFHRRYLESKTRANAQESCGLNTVTSNESAIPGLIRQAILDAFKVQGSLDVKIASATVVKSGEAGLSVDCLSVIGLKASGHTGSLSLWFPKETYLALLERMLGEKYPAINNENADACGEFLNIIYASARLHINQAGFDFQPAIPTTICGTNLSVATGAHAQTLRFVCESELGSFGVGFSLQKEVKPLSKAG
ncbi:MAG: chemotaxis protein CheX [Proteobacteria bacterium]|nr:MAG: chemotaxis protein CheX [Pseudomonadota bacterium]